MNIKLKLAKGAATPARASSGACAFDLVANIDKAIAILPQAPAILVPTGVSIDMTDHPGLCAMVLPRSGLGHKMGLVLGNGVGLIDTDYQGEIMVSAWNRNPETRRSGMGIATANPILIQPGDRIAQLVFIQTATNDVTFEAVEAFEASARGAGGFGSTGVKSKG